MKAGDQRFHEVLDQLAELHDKKSLDYGVEGDPCVLPGAGEKTVTLAEANEKRKPGSQAARAAGEGGKG